MNWERKIEHLAMRARAEEVPTVDVAHRVMETLAAARAEPLNVAERFWMWLAAISSAVAVPAATAAFILYARSAGPLSGIAEVISWAIQ